MTTSLSSTLFVNRDRLVQSIENLAQIGQTPQGGVRRIAYSPEEACARDLVKHWMIEAGMSVRIDAAGNIIGRYPGKFSQSPALATGSHIDTVPNGGRYSSRTERRRGPQRTHRTHKRRIVDRAERPTSGASIHSFMCALCSLWLLRKTGETSAQIRNISVSTVLQLTAERP